MLTMPAPTLAMSAPIPGVSIVNTASFARFKERFPDFPEHFNLAAAGLTDAENDIVAKVMMSIQCVNSFDSALPLSNSTCSDLGASRRSRQACNDCRRAKRKREWRIKHTKNECAYI